MDKAEFGSFIAELRKEKNMTQKELADKLVISDKAVSKWERGISYPDITLLEPLSLILDVSITELVKGGRRDMGENNSNEDEIMQNALEISNEQQGEIKKHLFWMRLLAIVAIVAVSALECLMLVFLKVDMERASTHLWTVEGLAAFFGIYFWVVAREKIPVMYDENKLSFYSDGVMRMNVPGVHFNNSNWPHILCVTRIWSAVVLVLYPVATLVFDRLNFNWIALLALTLIVVFSIFIPIVYVGRKYE